MANPQDSSSSEMTFFEHIDALRPHLMRAAGALVVFLILAFVGKKYIVDYLLMGPQSPEFPTNRFFDWLATVTHMDFLRINEKPIDMIVTTMAGQFNLHLRISVATAFVVAVPYILFEIWQFVKPALTKKELRGSRMFVLYVSLCFFTGLFFGYFIISPLTINFLNSYVVSTDITNMIDINSYLSTIINLSLACALVFQLPLLVYFLAKMGIVTAAFMKNYRRHALVVLLILAALITPPDAFSLILVTLPLYALYEVGIMIAGKVEKKKADEEEEYNSSNEESEVENDFEE